MTNKYLNKLLNEFIRFTVPQNLTSLVIDENNISELNKKSYRDLDYIILKLVIEEKDDIQKLLEDANKILKANGKLIIIFQNYLYSSIKNTPQNFNWLTPNDINSFLNLSGFEKIVHQPLCLLGLNIPIHTLRKL